jgi:hypothetical protein
MKQIFLDGEPCQLFFSETSSTDSIIVHLIELVMFDKSNVFGLKEQHSCCISPCDLTIRGDEDYKELTIVKIEPIKL